MDDIWFRAPVEIGAMLYFNSQICYVQVSAQHFLIMLYTLLWILFTPLTQCDQLHTHYFVSCRTTTSKPGSQQRWWTPRRGTCPSPTSSTSPSWRRRRPRPSLCQRLTMRWPRNIYNPSILPFCRPWCTWQAGDTSKLARISEFQFSISDVTLQDFASFFFSLFFVKNQMLLWFIATII